MNVGVFWVIGGGHGMERIMDELCNYDTLGMQKIFLSLECIAQIYFRCA